MNCEQATQLLSERLAGMLTHDDAARLERHLADCPACREEANAMAMLAEELDRIGDSVPQARMRSRFHAALAAYEDRTRGTGAAGLMQWLFPGRLALPAGLAAAALVVGVFVGRLWPDGAGEIDMLRQEVRAMGIALLDHQSASERLLGVEYSAREASYTPAARALLDVARTDANLNVRLAAVDALAPWTDQPEVAAALLEALASDQAPLMQVTLTQLLLTRDVAGTAEVVERLLQAEELQPDVREFLRTSLTEYENRVNASVI